jgi:hemolysin III
MVGMMPISLMSTGGLSYTGGLLFYRCDRLPFSSSIWHLCVLTGSTSFYFPITHFVQI